MDAVQFFKIKSPEKFQINNLFTREVHKNFGALTETAFFDPINTVCKLKKNINSLYCPKHFVQENR